MTRVAHFFQIDDVVAMVSLVILNHDSNQNDRARMNLHPSFFSSVSVGCPECGILRRTQERWFLWAWLLSAGTQAMTQDGINIICRSYKPLLARRGWLSIGMHYHFLYYAIVDNWLRSSLALMRATLLILYYIHVGWQAKFQKLINSFSFKRC